MQAFDVQTSPFGCYHAWPLPLRFLPGKRGRVLFARGLAAESKGYICYFGMDYKK